MQFEDLQGIWDTQNAKPVFAIQDARLLVALYQQREHSRRRLFRQMFAPLYLMAPIGLVGLSLLFIAFFWKSIHIEEIARDFPMSPWDYVAFAVAAAALVVMVIPPYVMRRRHEPTQEVFAPTLRQELERGISQLDFERSLYSTRRMVAFHASLLIAVLVFCWESGRLNGNVAPWDMVWLTVPLMAFSVWTARSANEAAIKQLTTRRQALETMLAALEGNP